MHLFSAGPFSQFSSSVNNDFPLLLGAFRTDGRKFSELRKFKCQLAYDLQSDGSAYYQQGLTQVLCLVKGPIPNSREKDRERFLNINYEVAPFSGTDRRKVSKFDKEWNEFSENLCTSFESLIISKNYSKSMIQIYVVILSLDGSHKSAVFNAITLALLDAGIQMKEFLVSCTVGLLNNQALVDITYDEQKNLQATLTLSYLPKSDKIDFIELKAQKIQTKDHDQLIQAAIESCKIIYNQLRQIVVEVSLQRYFSSR